MENNDKLKEELHQYTLDIDEQQKIQARLIDESDYFNRILRMNTEAERRKIAAMAMQGLLRNPKFDKDYELYCSACYGTCSSPEPKEDYMAMCAVRYADALLTQLNKKKI